MKRVIWLALLLICVACGAAEEKFVVVTLDADGATQTFSYADAVTVAELLAGAQIVLGERDRVSHPLSLQIADGMRITVRRVRDEVECLREPIPFQRRLIAYEGIPPGEERLRQSGKVGEQEACFRLLLEDDIETGREMIGEPTIITAPEDEILIVGPAQTVRPREIPGRLSYINAGVAWTMRGNSRGKAPLRHTEGLDSLVFAPNAAGTHLLYTAASAEDVGFFNELWLLAFDDENALPRKLAPVDVLDASWRPGWSNALAYSTGERGRGGAAWKALNNLWLMQIDLASGLTLAIDEIVSESGGGKYGWWGSAWLWSPRGDQLAWINAEAIGLVDMAAGKLNPLLRFAPFNTSGNWAWLPQASWSLDGSIIVAASHGLPLGSEAPETSPVFDLVALGIENRFNAILRRSAGMWSSPRFSPRANELSAEEPSGYLAWLRAREPFSSLNSGYDLIVADRDGSNQRVIFPAAGAPPIYRSDSGLRLNEFAWSPDARYIALIYQGDLWLVDAQTGESAQLTFDGGASSPVWTL